MGEIEETVVHREAQPFPWWVGLLMVGLAVVDVATLAGVLVSKGDQPGEVLAAWGVFAGVTVLLVAISLLLIGGMQVRVTRERVYARIGQWPLWSRWEVADIVSACPVTYRPIPQFGGWGIRANVLLKTWAYNGRGNRGALLSLTSGKRILLGSDDPESLCSALATVGIETGPALDKLA